MKTPAGIFLVDLALTVLLSFGIILYLKTRLRALVIELCGSRERGGFWLAFSNISLLLVPLIFALDVRLAGGADANIVLTMASQIKVALLGQLLTLIALALTLFSFIPRSKAAAVSSNAP
jgi:hypothetical protein